MNETDEKIQDYYREVYGEHIASNTSIEDLIESHTYLRSLNLEIYEERKKIMKDAWDNGYEDGKKAALEQDFVSVDKLRKMSVAELIELLRED